MLWQKLQDANIKNVDFVGSLTGPNCNNGNYDSNNEGHSGFLATGIVKDNQLPGWLSANTPDVILMHLGTNDVIQKKSSQDIIGAYSTLVDQMRASNSKVRIIVSHLRSHSSA